MSARADEPVPDHTHTESLPEEGTATTTAAGGLAVRIGLTLLGAAGLIVGAFMPWIDGTVGTEIELEAFWTTGAETGAPFIQSAGFVAIVLGLVALVGLAPRSGVLTSVAGALGIVACVLLGISLFRADEGLNAIDAGLWLVLVGGILALIGGFFGTRPQVVHQVTTVESRPVRPVQ